jgi:hypothetical protein
MLIIKSFFNLISKILILCLVYGSRLIFSDICLVCCSHKENNKTNC